MQVTIATAESALSGPKFEFFRVAPGTVTAGSAWPYERADRSSDSQTIRLKSIL
jgi:hypothetical protein